MKINFATLFLFLAIILLSPLIVSLGVRYIPGDRSGQEMFAERVYGERELRTSLVIGNLPLKGIGVVVGNPNLSNKQDLILKITNNDGKTIRQEVINGGAIPDGDFIKFFFMPISSTEAEKIFISFSSPSSSEEKLLKIPMTSSGEVVVTPLYESPGFSNLIKAVYIDWMKRFFADVPFSVIYLSFVGIAVFYLITSRK